MAHEGAASSPRSESASASARSVPEEPAESRTLSGPPTELTPPNAAEQTIVGTVVEHLPTGNYHYLRIEPEQGNPRWVVTMGGEYREGERVVVNNLGARRDFYSRRLDRSFEELVFGTVDAAS